LVHNQSVPLTVIQRRLLDYLPQWCKHLISQGQFGLHRQNKLCLTAAEFRPKRCCAIFVANTRHYLYVETAIATALKLEAARYRNSSSAIPAGVLRQTGGEPLSAQELADLAAAFNAARETNQTAALNEFVSYTETATSPDKMLLIDSAEFQAMEMARLCNIPPYLAGVSSAVLVPVERRGAHGLVDIWRTRLRRLHRWHTKPKQYFA
jgi:hypothetical protein